VKETCLSRQSPTYDRTIEGKRGGEKGGGGGGGGQGGEGRKGGGNHIQESIYTGKIAVFFRRGGGLGGEDPLWNFVFEGHGHCVFADGSRFVFDVCVCVCICAHVRT